VIGYRPTIPPAEIKPGAPSDHHFFTPQNAQSLQLLTICILLIAKAEINPPNTEKSRKNVRAFDAFCAGFVRLLRTFCAGFVRLLRTLFHEMSPLR
jgi:hypothetical protein